MAETKEGVKTKDAPKVVKGALIVNQQLAQKIMAIFEEMPRRYSNIISPVEAELRQCPMADVTLNESLEKQPNQEK